MTKPIVLTSPKVYALLGLAGFCLSISGPWVGWLLAALLIVGSLWPWDNMRGDVSAKRCR